MDALAKVNSYLGAEAREVREWAHVYWVRPAFGRPTLLSKKMVDRAAELYLQPDVVGNAYVKDSRTGKFYFVARPNVGFEYQIEVIEESMVGRIERRQMKGDRVSVTDIPRTPTNLLQLMVRKVSRFAA